MRSFSSRASLQAFAVLAMFGGWAPLRAETDPRANFIIVLCDDLGYGDLRCYGNRELRTPHLDRFAAEGLRRIPIVRLRGRA